MRRTVLVLAVLLVAALAAPSAPAAVTATPLTTLPASVPISAYGGWVAWSEKGADGLYRIVTFHDGRKETLGAVAPRTVPFDLDAGPDQDDRPDLTFSRCAVERDVQQLDAPMGAARSCRLHQASLPGGGESALAVPGRGSASDATPSRWGYRIAFQRRVRGADVSQIKVYDVLHRRMKTLAHGTVPHRCPYRTGCGKARYRGEVDELDLGVHEVAYSWRVSAPAVMGTGTGWEARVVGTATGRGALLAGDGYVSGACGGRTPLSPQAVPGGILFTSLQFFCERPVGTVTATTFAAGGRLSRTTDVGGGVAYRVLRDAADGTTYAVLRGATADGPLTLARLDGLRLAKTSVVAHAPYLR